MVHPLEKSYKEKIISMFLNDYKYININQIPKIEKILINRGLGDASQNSKLLDACNKEVSMITGQRPITTKAKKAIAGFKLRQNMPVGLIVTLRGERMYSFLDRLITIVLPRIRDFKGISFKSFDGFGNLNIGIDEQLVFPEINYDMIHQHRGMNISIITTAKSDNAAVLLLEAFGLPFQKI